MNPIKNYAGMFFIMTSTVLIWSCNSSSRSINENEFSSDTIKILQSTIHIPVDSLGLIIYQAEPVIYEKGGEFFMYAYNRHLHSYDIYNLTSKEFDYRIHLSRAGPNEVNKVYSAYVKNPDSIYVMGAGRLYLLDKNGAVRNSYNTMFESSQTSTDGYFHSPNEADFKIDEKGESFIGFFIHNDTKASERTTASLSSLILGNFNLKSNSISFYPVSYSEFIMENKGDFTEIKPNFSFIDSKLYYGFPIESNIYEFDFLTEKNTVYGAKSQYSKNQAERYSFNPDYDYRNEGTWFNSLNKYPGKPYYYRTHWGSQEKLRLNGEPTNALTKPGYIVFFDSELKIIKEIEIDKNCYLEGSFATNEGIFFWAKDGTDESLMKLCNYSIQ